MTDDELAALAKSGESDRVERKESLANKDAIREAICAFANDLPRHGLPGVVFVGLRDDGGCAELAITGPILLQLAAMRDDGNILPLPALTVEKKTLHGCDVAVVIVEPSPDPPVRMRGRTFIRVGPRRALASPAEEQRLAERRRAGDAPFDLRPAAGATLEDLDGAMFERDYLPAAVAPEVLDQNQRTREQQLAGLRLATAGSPAAPTNLGILVCGRDPLRFLPGAYAQFARYAGADLSTAIVDSKQIDGPLPEMLRRLRDWREEWRERLKKNPDPNLSLPSAEMSPAGYVVLQHAVRLDRPVSAYERWIQRIPAEYSRAVLDDPAPAPAPNADPRRLALLKNYRSLMPLAQEARKPMFDLKPADGAMGSHFTAAKEAYRDFKNLAGEIARRVNVGVPVEA